MTLLQRHDKTHETDCVERETDDPMVCGEREEVRLCKDNMLQLRGVGGRTRDRTVDWYLEIVNNTLAIQEIICCGKKVPAQGIAPWVFAPVIHGF